MEAGGRKCVCCGAHTPSRTMCACWPHWMALPENLRSELLTSFGRGELTNYHRHLLRAVEIWRQRGVWRVRSDDGSTYSGLPRPQEHPAHVRYTELAPTRCKDFWRQ